MRKNTTTPLLKECIVQSLLFLLCKHDLAAVSIKDIASRAGVNRSTYYRHFKTKQDIIRYYYETCLDRYLQSLRTPITPDEYFSGMFSSFLQYKKDLLLLHKRGLSILLLNELNRRISRHKNQKCHIDKLYFHYHVGGVFNCFCQWIENDMATSPQELAIQCLKFLPEDFYPCLIQTR